MRPPARGGTAARSDARAMVAARRLALVGSDPPGGAGYGILGNDERRDLARAVRAYVAAWPTLRESTERMVVLARGDDCSDDASGEGSEIPIDDCADDPPLDRHLIASRHRAALAARLPGVRTGETEKECVRTVCETPPCSCSGS